jgi:uncharacterized protein (TIGR03663 family)
LLFLALATHFYRLGDRAMHHDESIHAYQSYSLSKDGNWRYDPAYHGPFLYYATALVYKLAGASNTTARLLPALFGILLIAFAWPLTRWIGKEAALAYALLVLISPHFTYFARFIREDMYSLVFTFGTILAFKRFLETDRAGWLTLSAVAFALAGVTKENAYMTGVLFVGFGLWVLVERAILHKPRGKAVASAIRSSFVWIRERWMAVLSAGLVFLFIWVLMYTAFGRYPGDWWAIGKAVKYWIGQHTIARIPGPWYYHFPQLLYYETGFLLAAVFAFTWRQWCREPLLRSLWFVVPVFLVLLTWKDYSKPEMTGRAILWLFVAWLAGLFIGPRLFGSAEVDLPPFVRFLIFWTIGSLALYAWAKEKVPWLSVHPLLPLTILSAMGLTNLWRHRRRTGPRFALAAIALLLAVNASGMLLACFRYGAYDCEREPRHGELLAYVQTTEDLVRALSPLEKARQRVPPGQALLTVTGEASWPLTWYLRDVPTKWASRVEEASTPILVADWDPDGALQKQLAERYSAKRVPIRAWWFPEVVRAAGGSGTHPSPPELLRWWLFHEIWSPIGSQDATFYVRKDLEGTGPLESIALRVVDTSARDYSSGASTIAAAREWGKEGSGPGELSEPRGLASDARGNLYVADTKNHRIQVFDGNGQLIRQFGSQGSGDGQFKEPCGVFVDAEGGVWVADTWNQRIAHLGPEGQWLGSIGGSENGFFGPRSVLVSRGSLYVADTGNKRIVRFDLRGNRLSGWGGDGTGAGQFIEPVGLAADASGNIYVADTGNHRIQVFDSDGKFLRQLPVSGWKDFYTEPYLVVGPSDTLFVTDASMSRVAQYDHSGVLRRTWKPERDFKQPTGITLDPFGRLTVSDRGTHRLFTWSLESLLR